MIGARDVAFPRLNAFSYWVFLAGGLFMNASFFTGDIFSGRARRARRRLVRLRDRSRRRRTRPATASTSGRSACRSWASRRSPAGLNFIVTILNMRAPGMTLFRMPVFVWMTLVTSFLIIFAMPVIAVALFELIVRPAVRRELLQPGRPAATRCSGSTCSGSSAIRRCTSSSCRRWASSPRSCRRSRASRCSATRSSCSRASRSAS